jgi:Zincin-like metallopeptidase
LELRPRKLREAAALWERLTQAVGVDARDAVWQHPDLLPASRDLDEPAAFIDRVISGHSSEMDEVIAEFERDLDPGNGQDGPGGAVDN